MVDICTVIIKKKFKKGPSVNIIKKTVIIISAILILATIFITVKYVKQRTKTATHTIGILQTASHPALDASRNGFTEELTQKMGNTVAFVVHNAQGSTSHAHALAQQFHASKDYDGFFAIATPAAQAMATIEKERPIIIAAVTDPYALGLIHTDTNVCGVRDMINVKATIDMLVQLLPDVKTVGLLYTAGETNSIILVKQMHEELAKRNLTAVDFALSGESDVQATVELACRKIDALLTPTDNTVASAISLISTIALKNKKPLIVSDNMLVKFGALASRGVDYKASGKRAAQIAYDVIINNKKPSELPIAQASSEQIFVNKKTLDQLELTIPVSIQPFVILVS